MLLKIKLSDIQQVAQTRNPDNPQAYVNDVLNACAVVGANGICQISLEKYNEIRNKYGQPSKQTIAETVKAGFTAINSVIRTSLGVDVAEQTEQTRRRNICQDCPSKVVVLKDGKPFSCGRIMQISKQEGKKTCGCILNMKIRDANQHCPNGHW